MTVEQRSDEPNDRFPVGMRVLAVDDDPTCLRLLDTLLRKCQYHVTTTNQAITALKLLRENKDKFDLVISDVHMPDMDGFKLLELVGLEMDLPVIMLSANSDYRLVKKGIDHGACDYLLKPIRMEELKLIWQHVIRRKKIDPKEQKKSANGGEPGSTGMGDSDKNVKLNRKRKDQVEDDNEENDENGQNDEDPSTQKKPRVVWSVELHRKFVAAVHQLGIERAVPKRILDLMNVEKLTRENVASHLQKYRLYLKRISCVANQQANMVAALGSAGSTYMPFGSLGGTGNIHNMAELGQFQNSALRSSTSAMLGRLNSPVGLVTRGLSTSGFVQVGHGQNPSNPISDPNKFHQLMLAGNHTGNVIHEKLVSLGLDEVHHNKGAPIDVSRVLQAGSPETEKGVGDSGNSLVGVVKNTMALHKHPEELQRKGILGNQYSATVASSTAEISPHFPDKAIGDGSWQSVLSSQVPSNSFTRGAYFKQPILNDMRENTPSLAVSTEHNPHGVNSITSGLNQLLDPRSDFQCQVGPANNNAGQNLNYIPKQRWDGCLDEASHSSNLMSSSVNSLIVSHGVVDPFYPRNNDLCSIEQSNFVDPLPIEHNEVYQLAMNAPPKLKQGYLMDHRKPQESYSYNNVDSLEDLVSVMMKQEQDKLIPREGDIGYDSHSLETCLWK